MIGVGNATVSNHLLEAKSLATRSSSSLVSVGAVLISGYGTQSRVSLLTIFG